MLAARSRLAAGRQPGRAIGRRSRTRHRESDGARVRAVPADRLPVSARHTSSCGTAGPSGRGASRRPGGDGRASDGGGANSPGAGREAAPSRGGADPNIVRPRWRCRPGWRQPRGRAGRGPSADRAASPRPGRRRRGRPSPRRRWRRRGREEIHVCPRLFSRKGTSRFGAEAAHLPLQRRNRNVGFADPAGSIPPLRVSTRAETGPKHAFRGEKSGADRRKCRAGGRRDPAWTQKRRALRIGGRGCAAGGSALPVSAYSSWATSKCMPSGRVLKWPPQ